MAQTRTRKAQLSGTDVRGTVTGVTGRIREMLKQQSWWETTLLVIGLVTLITAISVLFLGMNSTPRTVVTSAEVAPVQSPEFAIALSRLVNSPIERGGTVDVLNNGDEFVPALLESINSAKHSINFTVYIWKDGTFSDQVMDALIRRQSEGVAVRVLLDGLGGKGAPDNRLEELENLGGRVEKFRMPKFGTWTRFHRRNHRRSIVIDGQVGFTGGMAVDDQWLGHAQDPEHWRDVMFKVSGPLASSLQGAFVDIWAGSTGEILVGDAMYPPSQSTAGVERFVHLVNSPADDDQAMANFFLMSIFAARAKLYVTTPYFVPDEPLKEALGNKARAGLDVRLLLPGPEIDHQMVRWSGQHHYDDLLEAGVKIYEYRPTFLHAKYLVVDGRWSLIGSPNLNSRSRQLDEENAFGILDSGLGRELEQQFLADLRQSDEITLEQWRRRNPARKILELFSRVLDQQS
jgi:cardiolipin synthase